MSIVRPGNDGARAAGALGGGALGGVARLLGGISTIFAAVSFIGGLFGGGKQVGPRLTDLNIPLDGEGLEIPIDWGCNWHDGRLAWTSGLVETTHTKGGGLFGAIFGGGKTITYTYSAKGAWLICGRITRVRCIRLGSGPPIYDWNGGDQKGAVLTDLITYFEGQTLLKKKGQPTAIRVYPGVLGGPVDPAIVADKGVGQWTSYPEKCIVVLDIPDLTDYGNTLPRLSVEVEYTSTALSVVILEVAGWVGLKSTDFDLSELSGITVAPTDGEGFTVDSRRKASDIFQELGMVYDFDLVEENGVLTAKRHPSSFVATLQENELRVQAGYDRSQGVADAPQKETDEQSLPFVQEFLFKDKNRDGATGYRTARRYDAQTRAKATSSSSATLIGARGADVARRLLSQTWAAAKGRSGTLGFEGIRYGCADEFEIPAPDGLLPMLVEKIRCPLFGPVSTDFTGFDALVSNLPLPPDTEGLIRPTPIEPGSPIVFAAMMSLVSGSAFPTQQDAFIYGVCRSIGDTRWEGADVYLDELKPGGNPDNDDDWAKRSNQEVNGEAIIGELTAPFSPSTETSFSAKVYGPNGGFTLTSAGADTGDLAPCILIFQNNLLCRWTTATQTTDTDPDSRPYTLSGVTSGLYGSDDFDDGSALSTGTRFMVLSDANGNGSDEPEWIPLPKVKYVDGNPTGSVERRIRTFEDSGGGDTVIWELGTSRAENLRPPSPVVISAEIDSTDGLSIEGVARSRYYDDYDGQPIDHLDLSGGQGRFLVVMTSGPTSKTIEKTVSVVSSTGAFSLGVTAGELTTLFGSVPDELTGTVALYGTAGSPVQLGRAGQYVARGPALALESGDLLLTEDGSFLSLE